MLRKALSSPGARRAVETNRGRRAASTVRGLDRGRILRRDFDKMKPSASVHAPPTPHTTHLTQPPDSTRSGSGYEAQASMQWPHTASEPPRARRGGSTSIRSSCAPACCRARINCAPRASGRLSSTKRRARGSSATSSRQAWPQAAAVARGARAWLREWVNMRVVASSAPVMSLRVAHHHFARRAASEYSRHFSTTMRSSGS